MDRNDCTRIRPMEKGGAHTPLIDEEQPRPELERSHAQPVFPRTAQFAVAACMDELHEVFSAGTQAQKKHLLHLLVKEVRVYSRDAAEIWITFPQPEPLEEGPVSHSQIRLRASLSVRSRGNAGGRARIHP